MIIILTGIMGAGKSSTGKNLSKLLGYNFIDLDKKIEFTSKMTIPEIFTTYGEAYFRNLENKTLCEVLNNNHKNLVLALGGGTFTNKNNINLCLQKGIVVWLNMSIDIIENRLQSSIQNRPLLQTNPLRETLEKLLNQRHDCYAKAHIKLDLNKNYPISYITEQLLSKINDYNKSILHE